MQTIAELIEKQTEKVTEAKAAFISENIQRKELVYLSHVIDEYNKSNPSRKFRTWCIDTGYMLDFPDDIVELINGNELVIKP